jgi:hypothetical protein
MTHLGWALLILIAIIATRILWWAAMKDYDVKQTKRDTRRDYVTLQIIMENKE